MKLGQQTPSTTAIRRTARPLKLDLSASGQSDPLAGITPWGVEPDVRLAETPAHGGNDVPLVDMIDRASTQLVILRRAIDEATSADRIVRRHNAELAQRLQQGQRFSAEMDERLAAAGKAASVLERAGATLKALEAVVEQMRAAHESVSRGLEQRLARQRAEIERTMADQQQAFAARLNLAQQEFEQRMAAMSQRFEEIMSHAGRTAEDARNEFAARIERQRTDIDAQVEQACASADRHAAQVQARVSLVLDGATDRLNLLEQQGERIGISAQQHIDDLCAKAAGVLGHDPRSDFATPPRSGSLAHAVARAEEIVQHVDDSAIRIGAMRTSAESIMSQLSETIRQAEVACEGVAPKLNEMQTRVSAAMAASEAARADLASAATALQAAGERCEANSTLLSRQREDLASMSEAGRYHVEQARTAQQSLERAITTADERASGLTAAMGEITAQAENMVQLARDAAAVIAKANAPQPTPAE